MRSYPVQYVRPWTLKNGEIVVIRPIRPEDEPLMVRFHEPLSERSVYLRYFHMIGLSQRVTHERLARICFVDYDREMALVAERHDPASGECQIIAVGRLAEIPGENEAEVAVLVSDGFQKLGLGTELVRRLIEIGRQEGRDRLVAELLPENAAMQRVFQNLGFRLQNSMRDGMKAILVLEH